MTNLITTDSPLYGRIYHAPIDREFEQMLISAARYATGRRTYIVHSTIAYITNLLPVLSDWCVGVMLDDMQREFDMIERTDSTEHLGDYCDYAEWKLFKTRLENETAERTKRTIEPEDDE